MSRALRIAIMISLGVHVFFLSAVGIVNPASMMNIKPYSRVHFLGPILQKTAFDIMMENARSRPRVVYDSVPAEDVMTRLRATSPGRRPSGYTGKVDDADLDLRFQEFLADVKTVPDFLINVGSFSVKSTSFTKDTRRVIHRPDEPLYDRGLHGSIRELRLVFRILVSPDGTVKNVDLLNTSGDPQADVMAKRYVSGWLFDKRNDGRDEDEWQEKEITLTVR